MRTTLKFDGSNTGTYSRYVPENYIGFKVFIVCLVILALVTIALLVMPHLTLFEDGSFVIGNMNGCLPFNLCAR